jgi:RNA polymerase sigma-70 factor (ECF subfamily)
VRGGGVVTEPSLAERIRNGDRAAEDELVARFYRRVLLVAQIRLHDDQAASDIAQEVMLGVLRGVRSGRLNSHEHLAGYVLGTARNLISSSFRSPRSDGPPAEGLVDRAAIPSEVAELHEQVDLVRLTLDELDPLDRAILGMTLVEGMKPGEIAERLGMKGELVRKRKSRALKRVRELIQTRSRTSSPRH